MSVLRGRLNCQIYEAKLSDLVAWNCWLFAEGVVNEAKRVSCVVCRFGGHLGAPRWDVCHGTLSACYRWCCWWNDHSDGLFRRSRRG